MITRWEVENFKSVQDKTDLEIGPLTIFAGANSSGKSSFIQSILLVSQTMSQKKISSRSVVLNGMLIRLGQFNDIISNGEESREINIKCTCKPLSDQVGIGGYQRSYPRFLDFKEICFDVSFMSPVPNSPRDIDQLHPQLVSSRISCKYRESTDNFDRLDPWKQSFIDRKSVEKSDYQDAHISIKKPRKFADDLYKKLTRGYRDVFECSVDIDEISKSELGEEYYMPTLENGCIMRHFIPDYLLCAVDENKERALYITSLLVSSFDQLKSQEKSSNDFSRYSNEVKEVLAEILEETIDIEKILKDGKTIEFSKDISPEMRKNTLSTLLNVSHHKLINVVQSKLSDISRDTNDPGFHVRPFFPSTIGCAASYLDEVFSSSFKYLGPLRDAPRSLYPLSPSNEPYDIGLQGEYTAFVLELHKKSEVSYIPSSCFAEDNIQMEIVIGTLENALSDWLQYLEVAESLESATLGKQGYGLNVGLENSDKTHELTHVGVGVSQVLPILVAGLISNPDSTLVFEQPELHLHPRVQSLLADFFLSMTLSNRQCLIETHSEHLLNRLRYRIATASSSDKFDEIVKVYFVEKGKNGSSFEGIKVNEYGAISNWPKGFFDQSQEDIQKILKAASRKRKQKRETLR